MICARVLGQAVTNSYTKYVDLSIRLALRLGRLAEREPALGVVGEGRFGAQTGRGGAAEGVPTDYAIRTFCEFTASRGDDAGTKYS
jgi:hypothetical protein